MNKKWFYVLASPFAGRAEFIRAERHDDLAEAVRWMGTGVVATEDGAIVAFHESQLGFVEHVGAQVGQVELIAQFIPGATADDLPQCSTYCTVPHRNESGFLD